MQYGDYLGNVTRRAVEQIHGARILENRSVTGEADAAERDGSDDE